MFASSHGYNPKSWNHGVVRPGLGRENQDWKPTLPINSR
jgi:hypothetical protein